METNVLNNIRVEFLNFVLCICEEAEIMFIFNILSGRSFIVKNLPIEIEQQLCEEIVPEDLDSKSRILSNFLKSELKTTSGNLFETFKFSRFDKEFQCYNRPHEVMVETNLACNYRCIYCSTKSNLDENQIYGRLDTHTFDLLINNLIELNPNVVIFTGGEPLLRQLKFGDLFPAIKKLNDNKIRTKIFTNGSLLNRFINDFAALNLLELIVSVDTIDQDLQKKINGNGINHDILNSLNKLNKIGVPIRVNMVVLSLNYNNILETVSKLIHNGVLKISLLNCVDTGSAENKKNLKISVDQWIELQEKVLRVFPESIISDKNNNEQLRCKAGINFMLINCQGKASVCPILKSTEVGEITSQSLNDIWNEKTIWDNFRKVNSFKCPIEHREVIDIIAK